MSRVPEVEIDLAGSRRRRNRLARYVETQLLTPDLDFICPHYGQCRRSIRRGDVFREGTMSHVGSRFDLRRNGRPLRIMVVGQESGWDRRRGQRGGRRITLAERYATIHEGSGLSRRYYASEDYRNRNPHMRGTTSALRLIFGKGLGISHEQEFVQPINGRRFHIFDGFALVNRLLCSATPPRSSQGRSSKVMRENCTEHFEATLDILQPTLVILQGDGVRRWTSHVLPVLRTHSANLYTSAWADRRMLVCAFTHPSAQGTLRWGDALTAPYLTGTVVPTIRDALRRLPVD